MTDNQTSRVIYIGNAGSTQEQIATALNANAEFDLVDVITNLERLSIDISASQVDIILIDHELAQRELVDLIDDLALRFPSQSIVVLIPDDNPVAAQQVMLAGARAFIIKPFTQINLINTLRRVRTLDLARQRIQPVPITTAEKIERPLQTITVFSPKGGVGCTTIATNLAIAHYQEFGGNVLLIDGKLFFGHIDVSLNILSGNSISDLIPHASNIDDALVEDVVHKHASGISVLLAPRDLQNAQGIKADALFSVFMALRRRYDFIVIDGGNSLNENSVTLLDAADRILLVTTPDLPTLHDTSRFMQFSPTVAIPMDKLLILVNRCGVFGGIRSKDIESSLHHKIFCEVPDDEANAIRSLNRGVPLITRYPRSSASKAIKGAAKKLTEISQVELEAGIVSTGVSG